MAESQPKKTADELIRDLEAFDFDSFDVGSRRRVLAASRSLSRRLETTMDTMWQMTYMWPALYSALKVALDHDVFTKLGAAAGSKGEGNGEAPSGLTTAELAGADASEGKKNMMRRLLRHLVAMGVLDQPGPDLWQATRHTDNLRRPEVNSCIDYVYLISTPAYMHLPHYLARTGYREPMDVNDGNWQSLTGDRGTHFDWMAANPGAEKTFWNLMQGYASQRGSWVDVYPTDEIMRTAADAEGPLIVDVGGAAGHDIQPFVHKHPEAFGRLVFQDQPKVIADAEADGQRAKGLVPMVHDFFTPQPVKDARAYFMHWILHDWPDEKGRLLLDNIKPAMKRGYSRLLLNEIVIPPTYPTQHQTSVDLMMAAAVSARERTEEQWEEFLRSCGFRVVKFWHSYAAHESIIEAELI